MKIETDLIGREDLLKEVIQACCHGCDNSRGIRCHGCEVDYVIDLIECVPATDAAPAVRAKWHQCRQSVPKGRGQTFFTWRCSACHKHERKRSDYCPNCGAKMFEEADK